MLLGGHDLQPILIVPRSRVGDDSEVTQVPRFHSPSLTPSKSLSVLDFCKFGDGAVLASVAGSIQGQRQHHRLRLSLRHCAEAHNIHADAASIRLPETFTYVKTL